MPYSQSLSLSHVLRSMAAGARVNRPLFIRITVVFALIVAANSALNLSGAGGIAISLGLSLLIQVIYIGMITSMVVQPGPVEGVGQLWASVRPVLAMTIWTALAFFVSIFVGLVFLIIPGVFVATIWFIAIQVAVAEKTSVPESIRRSQELTKGHFWRVFAVLMMVVFLSLAAYVVALLITSPLGTGLVGTVVASFLGSLIAYPVGALAPACVYRILVTPPEQPQQPEPEPELPRI